MSTGAWGIFLFEQDERPPPAWASWVRGGPQKESFLPFLLHSCILDSKVKLAEPARNDDFTDTWAKRKRPPTALGGFAVGGLGSVVFIARSLSNKVECGNCQE